MPEASAVILAEQYRAALLKAERAEAVRLVNAYGAVYQRLQSQIDALTADIDAIIAREGSVSVWRVGRLDTLKRLKAQVLSEVDRFAVLVEDAVDQGARNAIQAAQTNGFHVVQAALPGVEQADAVIMASWQNLDPAAVESMLGFLSEDGPLKTGLRTAYGAAIADGVEKGLIESIALGYNPRKIAAVFQKQLGMGLVSALRTARTAQLYAYREATRASYMANDKIVKGWKWHSARDSRTCMSCIAMDGTLHAPDERLNDHWNGRCAQIPVTVSYRDLGIDVDDPPAPVSESAADWFAKQPESVQKSMMGPGKYDAYKEGQFGLSDLTKVYDDPVWGPMRAEAPLKDLVREEVTA